MNDIKSELYGLCIAYVKQRIDTAKEAINDAQQAAGEETKSSAGDKYETGRAMMQLEIEKNMVQLNEAQKLKQVLHTIDPAKQTKVVQSGSLVITDQGIFYLSISAGQLKADQKTFFAIAANSPIGIQLMGKSAGTAFSFNKKNYLIQEVW